MKDKRKRHLLILFLFVLVLCVQSASADSTTKGENDTYNVVKSMSRAKNREGDWVSSKKGYRFRLKNTNQYLKNCWARIDDAIYRFDPYGYRRTGMYSFRGQKYYLKQNGQLAVDFWMTNGSKRIYLQADGTMAVGFVSHEGQTYYFNKYGVMVRGLRRIDKDLYYFRSDGTMATGWQRIKDPSDGKTYRYYFRKTNGAAVTGWLNFSSGSFYFAADGKMLTSQWMEGEYLDKTGKVQENDPLKRTYIFCGDSRTLQLKRAVNKSNHLYICKWGRGYGWFSSTAVPRLQKYLDKNPAANVILNMGVNDLWNAQKYIPLYQNLIDSYPQARFYILSVNPVNDADYPIVASHNKTNQGVLRFNRQMKSAFPRQYLDSYTYLVRNGFDTLDGVHFTTKTYQKLYRYIISNT